MPLLPNLRLISLNIVRVFVNRITKRLRHILHELRKKRKRIRSAWLAVRNILFQLTRRASRSHKPFVRGWRRAVRNHQQSGHRRNARRIEREIKRAATTGSSMMVVGPWMSEVGYEILYWIPFLRWMKDRYNLTSEEMVVVSRGGVSEWYSDITPTYLEILDLVDGKTFKDRYASDVPDEVVGQKQLTMSALDQNIIRLVKERLGVSSVRICHPSLMYQLFRQFWFGNLSFDFLMQHVRFARQRAVLSSVYEDLPPKYVAVKFYAGQALPEAQWCGNILRSLVTRIASKLPVVVLGTGFSVDEHRDFDFSHIPGVRVLRLPLEGNLGVQTEIICRSQAFVSTCGGLAWLAPMLGIETVAVFADDRFLKSHLFVARHAYRLLESDRFKTVDLRVFEQLRLFDVDEKRMFNGGRH